MVTKAGIGFFNTIVKSIALRINRRLSGSRVTFQIAIGTNEYIEINMKPSTFAKVLQMLKEMEAEVSSQDSEK